MGPRVANKLMLVQNVFPQVPHTKVAGTINTFAAGLATQCWVVIQGLRNAALLFEERADPGLK